MASSRHEGTIVSRERLHFVRRTGESEQSSSGRVERSWSTRGVGTQSDKAPWRDLDLTEITGQTIETHSCLRRASRRDTGALRDSRTFEGSLASEHGDKMLAKD